MDLLDRINLRILELRRDVAWYQDRAAKASDLATYEQAVASFAFWMGEGRESQTRLDELEALVGDPAIAPETELEKAAARG